MPGVGQGQDSDREQQRSLVVEIKQGVSGDFFFFSQWSSGQSQRCHLVLSLSSLSNTE
jgi:hypothetical protein